MAGDIYGHRKQINSVIRLVCGVALLCVIITLPLVYGNQYLLHVIILANILAIFSISWDLLSGLIGSVNFGHSMFFGVGAYAIAFIVRLYTIPSVIGLIIGGLIAVLLSLVVGIPCLRLRGPYYVIATLAFSQVFFTLSMGLPKLTGGEEGMSGIPKFIQSIEGNYFFSFFLLIVTVISISFLVLSKFGRRLISLREDERLSEAAGVNTSNYKIIGAAISAFIAGVAGSYNCYYQGHASPDMLSISLTFSAVAAVVFGGMGTLYGCIIGAYVLTFLNEYLYFIENYRVLIYALSIMLIIFYSPTGLFGFFKEKLRAIIGYDNTPGT